MNLIGNLKIKSKLVLMLFFPLVGLLYFSTTGVIEKARQADEMASLEQLAGLAVSASALVHELQKERGMTGGFIGSAGEKFASELAAQRSDTDKRILELKAFLAGFDAVRHGSGFQAGLEGAVNRLAGLSSKRAAVSSLSISAVEAIAFYTETILMFLDVVNQIAEQSTDGEMVRELVAYVSFLQQKEHAGIERATLTNAFAAGRFASGDFYRFVSLVAAQESYARTFLALAGQQARDYYHRTVSGPAVEDVKRMRQIAVDRAAKDFGVDPNHWFRSMTEKINLMKDVETRLSEELRALAAGLQARARAALTVYAGVTLIAVLAAVVLAILLTRNIGRAMGEAVHVANRLAEGDLTVRVESRTKDETGQLLAAMQNMLGRLSHVIATVHAATENIASAAEEVSATAQSVTQSSSEQAASVEETGASIEEMTASINQNAENSKATNSMASKAAKEASEGGEAVKGTVSAMKQIAGKIVIIDDIAYQTNLLALNAAIEAARAGEHGKGFAVVAAEVRKLAERSQVAAQEIGELADSSVALAEKAGTLLDQIVPSIIKTSELVREITAASEEQSSGVGQINTAMSQLNQAVQQNASSAEELAATAEEMSSQSQQLQQTMSYFKVDVGGPAAAPRAVKHTREVHHVAPAVAHLPEKPVPARRAVAAGAPPNEHEFVKF